MEAKKDRINITVDLDFHGYDEDIQTAIREEILSQVKAETRKQCRGIRDGVAAVLIEERAQLIKQAVDQIKTLKLYDEQSS